MPVLPRLTTRLNKPRFGVILENLPVIAFLRNPGVQRFMLKSKIHRATLTGTELAYEGSIAIDRELLEAAEILPGEQVHVLNVSNGQRLITYAIEAPAGSGTMMLNGPAARRGMTGDKVVVLTYCALDDEEARRHKPLVVHVDERNRRK